MLTMPDLPAHGIDFAKVEMLRRHMLLSVSDMAKVFGISRVTYYSWVRGGNIRITNVPKVKRTDAIQSFKSQETIFVTLTDAEGATGRGYSYTIGDGGPSVLALLRHTLLLRPILPPRRSLESRPGMSQKLVSPLAILSISWLSWVTNML